MGEMKIVNFFAHPDDVEMWKAVAAEFKISMAKWMRETLNAAAGADHRAEPVRRPPPARAPTVAPVIPVAAQLLKRAQEVAKAKGGTCDNRLPKGTFCKRCGQVH